MSTRESATVNDKKNGRLMLVSLSLSRKTLAGMQVSRMPSEI